MTNKELFDRACTALDMLSEDKISLKKAKEMAGLIRSAALVKKIEVDKAKIALSGGTVPDWV